MSVQERPLHLNLSLHIEGHAASSFRAYRRLAQQAEDARLDSLLIPDTVALTPAHPDGNAVYGGLEAFTLLSALAVLTRRIGLIATASTVYNEPYHIARKLATLDHVSRGRAGWNIVTASTLAEDANFGIVTGQTGQKRSRVPVVAAPEFVDVVGKLWDSWEDEAPIFDKVGGIQTDPERVRQIDHRGEWFAVEGPLNIPRPIQGHPVRITRYPARASGTVRSGVAEAEVAATAEVILATGRASGLRSLLAQAGQGYGQVRILTTLPFVLARTTEKAHERAEAAWQTRAAGGESGFIGTPTQLVDRIEKEAGEGIDGYDLHPAYLSDFEAFAEEVIPLLQRRGLFRREYEGTTLREHLGLERPVNRYAAETHLRALAPV